MEVSKRDCRAPRRARSPLMNAKAESTVLSASVALPKVVTSRSETFFSVEPMSATNTFEVVTSAAKDFSESSVM